MKLFSDDLMDLTPARRADCDTMAMLKITAFDSMDPEASDEDRLEARDKNRKLRDQILNRLWQAEAYVEAVRALTVELEEWANDE